MLAVKSLAVLAVAFTACHVSAFPGNYYSAESDGAVPSSTGAAAPTTTFGKWIAPSADAARSPCPAMNTLANHGEIARSGRGISTDELVAAMKRVYNLSPLVGRPFAAGGSRFSGVIDLSALQEHGFIEHDVSLVHEDTALGNSTLISARLIDQLLAMAHPFGETSASSRTTATGLTLDNLAAFRRARLADSLSKNAGGLTFGMREKIVASGEAALLWAVMSRDGVLDAETARSWLGEERLPAGYQPPVDTVGVMELTKLTTYFVRNT